MRFRPPDGDGARAGQALTVAAVVVPGAQHLPDFPLYTEAVKFFNHRESMVRIAVRTLTLNVYRGGCRAAANSDAGACIYARLAAVPDPVVQKYIQDKAAAPYFANLVWFIGSEALQLDESLRSAEYVAP